MTSRDFCYWLQGYFEIANADNLGVSMTENQVDMIQKHLNLVFKHEIDPSMGDETHQQELNTIHNKPSLQHLGQKYGFEVTHADFGPSPGAGYVCHPLYGWYDPKNGQPRC